MRKSSMARDCYLNPSEYKREAVPTEFFNFFFSLPRKVAE
jgi:hypothetical protein